MEEKNRRRILFAICIIIYVIIGVWSYFHYHGTVPDSILIISICLVMIIYFSLSAILNLLPVKKQGT